MKILIAFGANINHLGLNDFTPLDLAMYTQCPEVEHVLLDQGAKGSVRLISRKHFVVSIIIACRPYLYCTTCNGRILLLIEFKLICT